MRRQIPAGLSTIMCLATAVLSAGCGVGGQALKQPTNVTATAEPTSCTTTDSTAPPTCWQLLAPLGTGGFPPEKGSNDSPKWEPGRWPMTLEPVIGFNSALWGVSQTHAWSSSDGLHWTHYPKTDWGERIWQAFAFFNRRLWMFGGLRYEDRVPLNDIWSSADGATWTKSGDAEWSPRKQHAVVNFRDKLWLFGGADKVQRDFSTVHALNDIWTSDDGLHWVRQAAAAPWSPREGAKVVVMNGALYLLGGEGLADVWRSEDGVNWTRLSPEAEWQPRHGYGTAVFGDGLWVYAGWTGKSTNAMNDIWYSRDGIFWVRQAEHAPWGPRSPRTIVYKDRLWIFSGKHTGATDNWGGDVWAMSLRR